jgi:hypothetical protein
MHAQVYPRRHVGTPGVTQVVPERALQPERHLLEVVIRVAKPSWATRLPDDIAERGCRAHPSESYASDPDDRRGAGRLAARAVG